MHFVLQLATAAAITLIAGRSIFQLIRSPSNLSLRVLVPGLLSLAFAASAGIPGTTWEAALGKYDVYIINSCWMTMAFAFAAFFKAADTSLPRRHRAASVKREMILLLAAIAVLIWVLGTAPPDTWHHPRIQADYRTWRNALFLASVDGYALVCYFLGVSRAYRYLTKLTHRWARWAVRCVLLGASGMALGVDANSILIDILHAALDNGPTRFHALGVVYSIGQLGGQLLLAVGLVLAAAGSVSAKVSTRIDHYLRACYGNQMASLWRALSVEFPFSVLPRDETAKAERGQERREFERRTSEITDGLARLAPYYAATRPEGVRSPQRAALIVWAALECRAADRLARRAGSGIQQAESPYPRLEPDFRTWRARARWMAQLGRELDRLGATSRPEVDDYASAS